MESFLKSWHKSQSQKKEGSIFSKEALSWAYNINIFSFMNDLTPG